MPKLLVHRPKKRKKPPCGRIVETFEPHSPFQILIDRRRRQLNLSTRELARLIDDQQSLSQSTLWMWLHNKNGYPAPRSFKPGHLQAIAKVLKLSAQDIKDSIDTSRPMFRPGVLPTPAPSVDAFGSLIEILENDKRRSIPRSYILNLAKNIRNGIAHSQDNYRR